MPYVFTAQWSDELGHSIGVSPSIHAWNAGVYPQACNPSWERSLCWTNASQNLRYGKGSSEAASAFALSYLFILKFYLALAI